MSKRNLAWMAALACVACPAAGMLAQGAPSLHDQTLIAIQQRMESGDLKGAREAIAAAEKTYPADGGLENLLGAIEAQQGDKAAARRDFEAALRHSPRLKSALANLGRLDMETADSDAAARAEAVRLNERIVALDPANEEAHYQLATLFLWEKNPRAALEHLDKLSAGARGQPQAQALACSAQAALGDRDKTRAAAQALAGNPELTEADADQCLPALRAARRADLIVDLYAAAESWQALTAHGQRMLGLAQEADGKAQDARVTLENAFSASDSKDASILIDLTRVAEAQGDHDGALGYLAHARDLKPGDASLAYEFGAICAKMGLLGEARKALAEALRLEPERAEYNLALGLVISFSADPAQALPYLAKYRALRPRDAAGLLATGETCFRAKDYDAAAGWLKQAAAEPSTAADAHFYLGRIARQQGRMEEAERELKQALALRPEDAEVLAELGQIAVTARAYPLATGYLERALKIDPESYAANFGLLQLYARTGDARREEQSKRFDAIKDKREERDRLMMRVIEVRPEGAPAKAE